MKRFDWVVLLLFLIMVFLIPNPAKAAPKDYCIQGVNSIGVTYVGKEFKLPAAGKCATWSGFCSSGCSPDNVQTGTACTASDGSHVSFVITTAYLASNRQWDWIRLDLPTQTGSGNLNDFLFS